MKVTKTFTYIPVQYSPEWKPAFYIPDGVTQVYVTFKDYAYLVAWIPPNGRNHDDHHVAVISTVPGQNAKKFNYDYHGGAMEDCIEYLVADLHDGEVPVLTQKIGRKP